MASPTGTFLNLESVRVEERINKSLEQFLHALCPVWRQKIVTSKNVSTPSGLGRDMKILHTFQTGLAGVVRPGINNADLALYGESGTALGQRLRTQQQVRTYPDPLDGPSPKTFRMGINMNSMEANIALSLAELQADNLDAVIGEVVAPKLAGWARTQALFLCNAWFLDQDLNFELAALPADLPAAVAAGDFKLVQSAGSGTYDLLEIDLSSYASGKSLSRFEVGQRLEIWNNYRTSRLSTATGETVFLVHSVSRLRGIVQLVAQDGSSLGSGSDTFTLQGDVDGSGSGTSEGSVGSSDGDIIAEYNDGSICYADMAADDSAVNVQTGVDSAGKASGTYSEAFASFHSVYSWLKSGAGSTVNERTLMGGQRDPNNQIDVSIHPEFESLVYDQNNEDLTENRLLQLLNRFHTAKMPLGQTIDTIFASDGVWQAYKESMVLGKEYLDRTGRVQSLANQGASGTFAAGANADSAMTITANGQSFQCYSTDMLAAGEVLGLKMGGGNWQCYVPPSRKGTTSFGRNESFVPFRFISNAVGGVNNMLPLMDASGPGNRTLPTEYAQMPGDVRMQLVPKQPAGLRIKNAGESRLWGS